MADLTVTSRREGPVGVLTVIGEARLENSDAIRTKGVALLQTGAVHLLVDVRAMAFVDSASIGLLLDVQKHIPSGGGRMILVGPTERIRKIISAMGLSGHIRTAPDEIAARTQFLR